MNYEESVAWLYATQMHGIKLGLGNIRRLCEALGVRLESGPTMKFLHVAGTNGKGSVCAMLDAVLRAASVKAGLFTSPHLVTFRERIRVDAEMISEEEVATGLTEIRNVIEQWEPAMTFFEITTALALAHFQRRRVQVAVLETGMGGRLDATNVVKPAVSVITPIAMDHQQWLGDSIAAIAGEKAGITKPDVPVVTLQQCVEVHAVLSRAASECGAALHLVTKPEIECAVNLAGSHQRWNAALALRALELAGVEVTRGAAVRGLAMVNWPGRFQTVGGRFVLDGAHNPAAARRLVETWREIFGDEKVTIVLGILRDKDVRGICEALLPIAARVFTVPVKNERTTMAGELAAIVRESSGEADCEAMEDLTEVLTRAVSVDERVLVTGSLFLVGEALTHFGVAPSSSEKSAQ